LIPPYHPIPFVIDLPRIFDSRGNLSFIEEVTHIPFKIRRVYWIYDVPGGEHRGGHAFRETEELIIALSGSFEVVLSDSENEYRFSLNRSYYGVFVPKMIWRLMENFSTNSLALIVASTDFSEDEYIRDFKKFKHLKNS
jgi:oxalate decarboxylase/phosphoglucose isomerase-like protein (cupin superfamily)